MTRKSEKDREPTINNYKFPGYQKRADLPPNSVVVMKDGRTGEKVFVSGEEYNRSIPYLRRLSHSRQKRPGGSS